MKVHYHFSMANDGRIYYIDNLKTLIILSLFLLHTCEVYHIDHTFWIDGEEHLLPTMIFSFLTTFVMGVLFFFAGMATVYSAKRRGLKGFYLNRCKKLLLPLLLSLVTILPLQNYFILKNHPAEGFDGTFLGAYCYFFTHVTDMRGVDGAISPAHLWFILYLFLITLLCFPLIARYEKLRERFQKLSFSTLWVCALVVVIFIVNYEPGDELFMRFLVYYALGIVLSENQSFNAYLEKRWKILLTLGTALNIVVCFLILKIQQGELFTFAYFWRRAVWAVETVTMTFGYIGMGKALLNSQNRLSKFFAEESFMIYILHTPFLIAIAYFTVTYLHIHYLLQMLLILTASAACTVTLVTLIKICQKAQAGVCGRERPIAK